MPPSILSLRELSVRIGRETILDRVSAEFPRGKITAVIGPNGGGKTTMIRAICGLIPFHGRIDFKSDDAGREEGKPLSIGYVPQRMDFDRGMPMSVLDFLCLSVQRRPLWLGRTAGAGKRASEMLESLNIAKLGDHHLGGLSGGELQRVLLAHALMNDPALLILDEPISGVDMAGEEQFCELLEGVHRRGEKSIILVTHDLAMVNEHADRVLCLNRRILFQGPTEKVLTPENISMIFGLVTRAHESRHGFPEHWFRRPETDAPPETKDG